MKIGGWTRIWLSASGIWLACTFYLAAFDIYRLRDTTEYQVDRDDFGKFRIVFSKAQPEDEAVKYINERIFVELEKSPKLYNGKVVSKPYDDYLILKQGPTIFRFIERALIPILGLLVIGLSLAWVRRGFCGRTDA
jgi:hypothetical protein